MDLKKITVQSGLIKSYYKFIGKLYGSDRVERNLDFEKRVVEKFGNEPDKDIDIEIALGVKTKSGKKSIRKQRSVVQFVEFFTKALPEDTTHIKFYAEFVERNNNQEKVRAEKKKDRFAFQEQIRIVENIRRINLSRRNSDIKYFEKDNLERVSEIIKFEKRELGV